MDSSTRALPAWAKAYSAQMSSTRYESGASQAVLEARSAAIEEVSKLLQAPEDLARVAALRAEYESKRASQKAQLTSLVQSHVEATRSGMEVLERGQKSVLKLRAAFEQIDRYGDVDQLITCLSLSYISLDVCTTDGFKGVECSGWDWLCVALWMIVVGFGRGFICKGGISGGIKGETCVLDVIIPS